MAAESEALTRQYRLKKGEDGTVFGPIEGSTLKEWADGAQVAPIDFIDQMDDDWRPAFEFAFLDMVWEVKFHDGHMYGPTTVGTLREFLRENIVGQDSSVMHVAKRSRMPLGALLASVDFVPRPDESAVEEAPAAVGNFGLEMAKDQRIRTLEEDLRNLRKEHDELLQKYRKLNQKMVETRPS